MRYWRTLRRLSPCQVAHRVRLRIRRGLRGRLVRPAAVRGLRRAGMVPALRGAVALPRELLRPCREEVVSERAREVSEGEYRFLAVARWLGEDAFPPPAEAPLLWAYELEYMDYLVDLALEGSWETVMRLAGRRAEVDGAPGVAGLHPYPESRRTSAWLETLSLRGERELDVLARGAWRGVSRIAANLERDVGGNHLLENGLALVLGGAAFTGERAQRVMAAGRSILLAGAREQVLPDGSHFELSPMYHARVLRILVEGALAMEGAGVRVPGEYWETVSSMVGYLRGILGPDGRLPLLGDTAREADLDPGRLLRAVEARMPFAPVDCRRGDRAYEDAGIYVFEERDAGHRLLLDAGPTCPARLPAHGQADTFSLTLEVGGLEMIVDPGLYEYRVGIMRDWCRSTRAHSTVEVDGEDSSEVWASFRVGRRARVRDVCWSVRSERGSLCAEHDGYRHRGVIHRRHVGHLAEGLWLVADRTSGRSRHTAVSRLHFHPGVVISRSKSGGFCAHREGRELEIVPFGSFRASWSEGWFCPSFGVRRESRVLGLSSGGRSVRGGFLLSTRTPGGAEVRVEGDRIEVSAGRRTFARRLP